MKTDTLAYIKTEIAKFHIVIDSLANYWQEFPQYTLISVLVQNAAHDATDCSGYDHNEAVAKLKAIVHILKQLKKYHNSYFEQYVYDEISMIVEGNEMSEMME